MVDTPLVLDYMSQLQSLPELRPFRTLDIATSFPIPDEDHRLHFFFYRLLILSANTTRVDRPVARVTVAMPSFELESLVVDDPFPDIHGDFPQTITRDFGDAVAFQLDALYSIYQTILHQYPQPQPDFILTRFHDLFKTFVPEPLLPFYRALNPRFAKWARL